MNQVYLDQPLLLLIQAPDDAKQYMAISVFTRHLLLNKKLSSFLKLGALNAHSLEQNFYAKDTGVFLNKELNEELVNLVLEFELQERQFAFSTDTRFYKQLSEAQQACYDKIVDLVLQQPKFTYSFRPETRELQQELVNLFKAFTIQQIASLVESFASQLDKIAHQKDNINVEYLKQINTVVDA